MTELNGTTYKYIEAAVSRWVTERIDELGNDANPVYAYLSGSEGAALFFWEMGRKNGMAEQRFLSNPELVKAVDYSLAHPEESVPRPRRERS